MILATPRRARAGFTLLELVIAVSLIAILAGLAAGDLAELMGRYRLNAAARELAERVVQARLNAIGDNTEYALVLLSHDPNPGNGAARSNVGSYEFAASVRTAGVLSFTRAVDGFVDLHAGPEAQKGVSIEAWDPISGPPGYGLANHVVFSPRGYLLNDPADFKDGVIRVVLRNKEAPFVEQRVVRIDRGGNAQIAAVE